MKRPLLAAALCIVVIATMRLETGGMDRIRPDCISTKTLEASETLLVTGQVYQKDEQSIYLKSIMLSMSNAIGQSAGSSRQEHLIENLICETETAAELPLGSWVTVSGIFAPYSSASNPGEFDAAVYYRTLGIGGKLRKTTILSVGEGEWPVREWLYQLKCLCKKRLNAVFPEKEAAIMSALLLGDKQDMDSEVKDMYKNNGILHIFSISSLHITIIGMGIYKLLRKVGIPVLPAALVGSILLILYGCMTGFGVSACRAIGMYLIRMLGEVVGRTYDLLTALGAMAAVMVIMNPYYLQNGGFLLSFTSVIGIGVVFPALQPEQSWRAEKRKVKNYGLPGIGQLKEISWPSKFMSKCKIAIFASLSITLTTLPVQLWLYYEIPTYSVFLNLIVIPFLKPLMIAGILTLLPGFGWLSSMDHLILEGYEFLCECFSKLPFHTWNPGCPELWQIVGYYILLLGVVAVRYYEKEMRRNKDRDKTWNKNKVKDEVWNKNRDGGRAWNKNRDGGKAWNKDRDIVWNKNKEGDEERNKDWEGDEERNKDRTGQKEWSRRITCISAAVLCAAVLLLGIRPANTDSVTFLDVGQGDCILVRTASGQTYLFDCGSSSRSSVGKYVLIPYLKYCGIHVIDAIFLSHPDADHVNGALELFATGGENGIAVRQLLLPAIEKGAREEQLGELRQAAEAADAQGSNVLVGYLSAGETWDCGSTTFTCLHPGAEYSSSDTNAYSECFYVEFPKWTLLLTGDVEGRGEAALLNELESRNIQEITVLKAAHHGSRNSSSEALLRQVSPRLTVISCGRNNRYGHPHKELLERLEQTDTYIMQTAQSGAITITYSNGNLKVSSVISK